MKSLYTFKFTLHAFFTLALNGSEKNALQYTLDGRTDVPQGRYGRGGEEKISFPYPDSNSDICLFPSRVFLIHFYIRYICKYIYRPTYEQYEIVPFPFYEFIAPAFLVLITIRRNVRIFCLTSNNNSKQFRSVEIVNI